MMPVKEKWFRSILEAEYRRGVNRGIELMKQKIVLSCETGNPIEIDDKVYFILSDLENLREIMEDWKGCSRIERIDGMDDQHAAWQTQSSTCSKIGSYGQV